MRCPTLDELPAPPPDRHGWPWTDALSPCSGPAPRISIVTPSFNQAPFLEETIRSILLQGYGDLEYIIIDGGSTDGSVDIIRKYEPWLTYWTSERDRGQCHAINKGLERCTGEYFNYVNADDTLAPGALDAVASAFQDDPSADMVHGRCVIGDERGRALSVHQGAGRDFREMFESLLSGRGLHPLVTFTKRDLVARAGGYREELEQEMDADLWLRLLEAGCRIRPADAELGMFRHYPQQKSASSSRIDELLAVLSAAADRRPELTTRERAELKHRAAQSCARQKLWFASSSFRRGSYGDYLKCCTRAVAMSPEVIGSWTFWTNVATPVKRMLKVRRSASEARH